MDSPWHRTTPPEVYLQCPSAAHASGNVRKIKLRAYLVIPGLREKLVGAAVPPGLIVPQVPFTHENCFISEIAEQIKVSYITPLLICQHA